MTSSSAGISTAGILVDGMPKQFVDDAGNLTFKVSTTGTISFAGETLPYEEPYVYAGYGNLKNWIISLNNSGVKKWNTSAYVSPTFYGVNPQSGEIYINYSYGRQNPAVAASIAPFSSLPNLAPPPAFSYIPAIYSWSGIITLNTSGAIVKTKSNYANAIAYPTQMQMAANGRIVLFSAATNGNVFKAGENFISFDGPGYAAMEVDADFNPLKVLRLPAGSAMALNNNKFAFGGSFKTTTTVGSTTLTANVIDTDFNTRFPAWGSIKTDVLIAEGNLDQVQLTPETTTWKGLSTNWIDITNWTNGIPTTSMRAIFSGTPTNMPASIPSSSKVGQIYIPAGAEITLPPGYGLLMLADRIFNDGKLTVENASFLFNFFGANEVKGNGEFYFKGAASVFNFTGKIANTVSFDNTLEMSGATVNRLKFMGVNAKYKGDVTISNSDENAISGVSNPSNRINGILTRAINSTGNYSFPVAGGSGTNEKSSLVSLTPSGLVGVNFVAAKYNNAAPTGTTPTVAAKGSLITSILNGGFLTLTPDQQPTAGTYGLGFSVTGSANTVVNSLRYLTIKRDNNTAPWIFQGENNSAPIITGSGTTNTVSVSLSGVNSFSDFAIGIANNPVTLPVKLVKFTAKAQTDAVLLNWETATEINSDKFIVERSTDGNQFAAIGEIKAKGNSTQQVNYNFRDKTPARTNYYRLKQVDLDGSFEYSNIAVADFILPATNVSTYPNPVSKTLHFNGIDNKTGIVSWFNLQGQKMAQTSLENKQTAVPTSLSSGVYFIKVLIGNGNSSNHKIIVNK